jgi:hypothetical protein
MIPDIWVKLEEDKRKAVFYPIVDELHNLLGQKLALKWEIAIDQIYDIEVVALEVARIAWLIKIEELEWLEIYIYLFSFAINRDTFLTDRFQILEFLSVILDKLKKKHNKDPLPNKIDEWSRYF